jgi:hypothetical protein
MKTMKSILLALILMVSLSSVFAEDNSAAVFTRLGIDARSIGMGGTGGAFLDNVSSAYLNPAVLADVKRIELTTSTRQGMGLDRAQNAVALGFIIPTGYVAAFWNNGSVSDFEEYDGAGNYIGTFNNAEHALGISYAAKLGKFNMGVTPKMYISNVHEDTKTGFSMDMGILFHVNRYFNMGFHARDLISDYDGDGTKAPRELVPSIAAFPIPGLILAADLSGEDDFASSRVKLGVEYWLGVRDDTEIGSSLSGIRIRENATWTDILSKTQAGIRAGVNDGAFSAGFGLRFKMLEMNYAYQMANDELLLNDSHLYSLLLRF